MHGREQVIHAILENKPMVIGTPESFKVLVRELQSV
jgi:DNA-directed RNA polymerase beta subunit